MESSLKRMERLLFDMLLATDGRTTDMLETLLDEKLSVSVLRQEVVHNMPQPLAYNPSGKGLASSVIRESVLIGARSGLTVSHNIALVHGEHVPPALFERIMSRREGIGRAIGATRAESFRTITDYGVVGREAALDLLGQPLLLQLPDSVEPIPYKKYVISFGLLPGIQLLEYFNPNMVRHRLEQTNDQNQGGNKHES